MGNQQLSILKKILKRIKRYLPALILSLILATTYVVMSLYIPILVGDAIDYIIDAGKVDFAAVADKLKAVLICAAVAGIAQWVMNTLNNRITYSVTRDIRNEEAKKLLDWGYANYEVYTAPQTSVSPVHVLGGVRDECALSQPEFSCVVPKGTGTMTEAILELPEEIAAPVREGQIVGSISYRCGEQELGRVDIIAKETVEKIKFGGLFARMLRYFVGKY